MNSRGHNNKNNNNNNGRRGESSRASSNNYNDHHHQTQPQHSQQSHQQQAHVLNLSPRDQADLDTFRVALKELTFNSRPIIEKLTLMAKERARSIPGPVSRSILDNLVFNNPKLRSCFLFLIDSICKAVGEPYPGSFVKHGLVSAYLRVYGEICAAGDEGQKRDFLRVLPTWNGIFPPEAIRELEIKTGSYISDQNTRSASAAPPVAYSHATIKLLQDLRSVFEKPPGPHISGIVSEIFNRLARGGEVSREILGDLDNKAKMPDKNSIISTIKGILSPPQSQSQRQAISPPQLSVNTNDVIAPSIPLNFELPPNFQIDLSLLSSIVNFNNSSNASSPTKSIEPTRHVDKHFIEIPLNSADFLVSHPRLFKVLYDDLALHCKTCGVRFRDTEKGNQRMTLHLDSHFRRNMRLKEKSKRVMARDWFGSENDWITAKSDSDTNSERTVNIFEDLSTTSTSDLNSSLLNQFLDESCFIEASEEEQNSQVKCSVCQEIVPLHWNDETEQWIFQGCVRTNVAEIVHKNCQQTEPTSPKRQKKN